MSATGGDRTLVVLGGVVFVAGAGNVLYAWFRQRVEIPAFERIITRLESGERRESRWSAYALRVDRAQVRFLRWSVRMMVPAGAVLAIIGLVLIVIGAT